MSEENNLKEESEKSRNYLSTRQEHKVVTQLDLWQEKLMAEGPSYSKCAKWLTEALGFKVSTGQVERLAIGFERDWPKKASSKNMPPQNRKYVELENRIEVLEKELNELKDLYKKATKFIPQADYYFTMVYALCTVVKNIAKELSVPLPKELMTETNTKNTPVVTFKDRL